MQREGLLQQAAATRRRLRHRPGLVDVLLKGGSSRRRLFSAKRFGSLTSFPRMSCPRFRALMKIAPSAARMNNRTRETIAMSAQLKLPSDIEGLARQVDPLSRRGFFMSSAAAAAAGYTLAAGPVRAQAITTDGSGLNEGFSQVKVEGGEMPVYFALPTTVQNPPVIVVAMEIFGLHEYIKDVTRRLARLGAFAVAPDYYFRKGTDLTKVTDIPQLLPIVNS